MLGSTLLFASITAMANRRNRRPKRQVPPHTDVNDPRTWPPGTMMTFTTDEYKALGLVVANRALAVEGFADTVLDVVWQDGAVRPHCSYYVSKLNSWVIARFPDRARRPRLEDTIV